MSHRKERLDKICLNCGAHLNGRFCHVCGQENVEPQESVFGLLQHYVYDIIHFDGKFFSTLKYLITKPGFLPKEYMLGRRASYLNPIRMYVFTSAFFFILFFSFFYSSRDVNVTGQNRKGTKAGKKVSVDSIKRAALIEADTKDDSAAILAGLSYLNMVADSVQVDSVNDKGGMQFSADPSKYPSAAYYDSVQLTKPEKDRDGWFMRRMRHQEIRINNKYDHDPNKIMSAYLDKLIHSLPQILFVSLPFFAFVLYLLYFRKRRSYYYADHIIFTVFLYIFSFISLLFFFIFMKLDDYMNSGIWNWLSFFLWLFNFFYLYKAMRVFYRQGRFKTIVKFLSLNFISLILLIIISSVYLVITAFKL